MPERTKRNNSHRGTSLQDEYVSCKNKQKKVALQKKKLFFGTMTTFKQNKLRMIKETIRKTVQTASILEPAKKQRNKVRCQSHNRTLTEGNEFSSDLEL